MKSNWKYYVDFVLTTILIIIVLYYGINGYFIKKQIVIIEVCNGQISPESALLMDRLGLSYEQYNFSFNENIYVIDVNLSENIT